MTNTSPEALTALADRLDAVRFYCPDPAKGDCPGSLDMSPMKEAAAALRSLASPGDVLSLETTRQAEPEGMETTPGDRVQWATGAAAGYVVSPAESARLLRDFDRMRARAEKAEEQGKKLFSLAMERQEWALEAEAAVAALKQPVGSETYYTKGKDAEWFEKLDDKTFAWEISCAAQDLNDTGLGDQLDEWMPHNAMLSIAGERIRRLTASLREKDAQIKAKDDMAYLKGFEACVGVVEHFDVIATWGTAARPDDGLQLGLRTTKEAARRALERARAVLSTNAEAGWKPTHRHYTGGLYRVLHRGLREEDLRNVVIYDDKDGNVWVRPEADFFATVVVDGYRVPRFTPLSTNAEEGA